MLKTKKETSTKSNASVINVDVDLYNSLVSGNDSMEYIRKRFNTEIGRMTVSHPHILSVEELVKTFVAYVAAICRLSSRNLSNKMSPVCFTRLVQRNIGDFSDTAYEMLSMEEENIITGYISQYNKLKESFREYTFDHIPEMVDSITAFVLSA